MPTDSLRILITGGQGQFGRALARRAAGHEVITLDRQDLDISHPSARAIIAEARPDVVVNAAACTDVDGCEVDPDRAYRVNALGARYVAQGSERAGAALVQVSTDFVFDGLKGEPYWEFDATAPISVYGASKLAGEEMALAACRRTYVARTAWLYGLGGRSFVSNMLELSERLPRLSVVDNEVGCPTFCDDLADAILALVATEVHGTYHLVSEGWCSRYDFARAILDEAGKPQYPIEPIDHYPRKAAPPGFAPLRNFAAAELGIQLPRWQDGLRRFLDAHLARLR
jgi:dTDP-4-dehydrorhamnose reductase